MTTGQKTEESLIRIQYKCTEFKETVTHWSWIMTPTMSGGRKDHPNYKYDKGYFMAPYNEFRHSVPKDSYDGPFPKVGQKYFVTVSLDGKRELAGKV